MHLSPRDVRRYYQYEHGEITGVAMRHLPTGIYTGLQPTLDDADQVLRACLRDHFEGIARVGETVVNLQSDGIYIRRVPAL